MSETNPTAGLERRKTSRAQWLVIAALVLVGLVAAVAILRAPPAKQADLHGHADKHGHKDEHGHDEGHGEAAAMGPHGGQLMTEGDFKLEVRLAEDGGEPRVKVWLFSKDKPLPPASVKVAMTVDRPDGTRQEITFAPDKDGFRSTQAIPEPHVFEATLEVQTATEPFLFPYSMKEGVIDLSDAQVKAAGVTLDTAGASAIRATLQLAGEIRFNEDRTARLVPRVAGVVESVPANIGQPVKKGQVLAVLSSAVLSEHRSELQVAQRRAALARTTYERERRLWQEKISPEQDVLQAQQALQEAEIAVANVQQKLQALGASGSSAALNRFELKAPFDGVIVEKRIAIGEAVKDDTAVFTLSDLSTVWAEVSVPARDLNQVRVGQPVTVSSTSFDQKVTGKVTYVSALVGEQTRAAMARVVLTNPALAWRPGLFVSVDVVASEASAAVTVAADAVQTVDGKPTVFIKIPGGFLPQAVRIGRSDGKRVEIVKGLKPGASYAASGSFVLKSEQGKASAGHGH